MTTIRFKKRKGAFQELRYSPEMQSYLEQIASGVAAAANNSYKPNGDNDPADGFRTSSQPGAKKPYGRWRTTVITVTPHARRHNAVHNTLLSVLGGGV